MTLAPRSSPVHIGVLALQGDFQEHAVMLRASGAETSEVRTLAQLDAVDGLVIPGGESTTIARLLLAFDLMEPLRERIAFGLPVWGTCAGAILLASDVPGLDRPSIGGLEMTVERNAFGTQVDSFEAEVDVAGLDRAFRAVFIRAPVITEVGPGVEVLARLAGGEIAAVRAGRLLATCFHPEITADPRMHALFVSLVRKAVAEGQAA
jgi:5'-phosphate synthase pdxT subunit